jgi:hypothetical protein
MNMDTTSAPNVSASTDPIGSAGNGNQNMKSVPVLKLIQSKTHLGPTGQLKRIKTDLSKATGKLLFNSELKLKVKMPSDNNDKKDMLNRSNRSIRIGIGDQTGDHAQQKKAVEYFYAWDLIFKDKIANDQYLDALQKLTEAQTRAYTKLGITTHFDKGNKAPELTEAQRVLYNREVSPFSFDYYEYRLSFKDPGFRAVRTKTYRTLKPIDMNSLIMQLTKKVVELPHIIQIEEVKAAN